MTNIPFYGIDTIRYIITLTQLRKLMKKLELEYQKKVSKTQMNRFKKEVTKVTGIKQSEYNLDIVKISKAKSLIGYMLVKTNDKSINFAKHHHKKKSNYKEVIFTSINQPQQKTHHTHLAQSYSVISAFINICKNPIVDFTVDGFNSININKIHLDNIMCDYIANKKHTNKYLNSYYINTIQSPNNPNFEFIRLNIYDKYIKHKIHKNWKRIELTVSFKKLLTLSKIDEMLNSFSLLSSNYFSSNTYSYVKLEQQQKQLQIREEK